jgi:outer membrane protein TolC
MMRTFLLLLIATLSVPAVYAQEFLSLDSAIAKALAQNYDVRIADVTSQVAAENRTLGNAGLLPTISATGNINQGITNTRLVRAEGTVVERRGAATQSYSGGLNGTYTVFAAGRAFLIYRQLGRQQAFAEAQLRAQIQSTVSTVIQAYAGVVNDQRQIVALDTAIALARARMELSRSKYEIGTSAKVDYLQARVDFNAARSQRLAREAQRATSQATLNEAMGEDAERSYRVADSLALNLALTPSDSTLLKSRSPVLDAQRINAEIANLDRRIARTFYFPSLDVNAGYGYNRTASDVGLTLSNRSLGPNVGLGINVPIFQGGNVRRQVRVANLNALSAELQYNRQERALSRQYRSAWAGYQSAVATYRLEEENRGYAQENLYIQQARFRVGLATSLEIREAENSYIATLARLYAAAFNVKVNETRVLEIEARLAE